MDIEEIIRHETARAKIYQALSICFHPPGSSLLDTVNDLTLQLDNLGSEAYSVSARLKQSELSFQNCDALMLDYTRMFVGPFTLTAPPYGSIYLENDRKVMGESTMDALSRYQEAGLRISNDFKNVPDHIAAELEFMYFLIVKEINTLLNNGKTGDITESLFQQKHFMALHLGLWAKDFYERVKANAETKFYQLLATVTHLFINEESHELSELSFVEKNTVSG